MPTTAEKLTAIFTREPHSIFGVTELAQLCGCDKETVRKTIDRMMKRPNCVIEKYSHGHWRSVNSRWEPWTLNDAVLFVRRLGQEIPRYNFALCGGVIHKRGLRKDVDIIVFPRNEIPTHWDSHELMDSFIRLGLELVMPHNRLIDWWIDHGEKPDARRVVEVWSYRKRRIDFFYMNGQT